MSSMIYFETSPTFLPPFVHLRGITAAKGRVSASSTVYGSSLQVGLRHSRNLCTSSDLVAEEFGAGDPEKQ